MRAERVYTHHSCNQNCTYCVWRRPSDDPAYISGAAVRGRIDAALAHGAEEITFSGGEPTMRRDLTALVAYARTRGARHVSLETNATLIDAPRAVALRDAGLGTARVNLTAWGDALDAITRDPGGAQRTTAGLRALQAAGIPIELHAVLIRSTLAHLPAVPAALHAALGNLDGIRALFVHTPVEAPQPAELVSYVDAAQAITALDRAARSVALLVRVAPDTGPPPCAFPHLSALTLYFSLTPGSQRRPEHRHFPVCEQCQVAGSCSGLPQQYLKRYPPPPMQPITDDTVRRRLSLIASVQEQVERELLSVNHAIVSHTGLQETEHLIRVNFHCNQACRFCFVSTHLPPPSDERIRQQIIQSGDAGVHIVLTGGEPTLSPNLLDYVRLARAHSRKPVRLQTNAMRLADEELTLALVDAGLHAVMVSLHGHTADTVDAVTGTPGGFIKTVAGLDTLRRVTKLSIILNFVVCQRNHHELPHFVPWALERWPGVQISIAFVAPSSDVVPKEKSLIPQYKDVLPDLAAAVREGDRLGVTLLGFEAMCGVPVCLMPPELKSKFKAFEIAQGFDAGEFVRGAACQGCVYASRCYGLRRGYMDLYGDGELRTVTREER